MEPTPQIVYISILFSTHTSEKQIITTASVAGRVFGLCKWIALHRLQLSFAICIKRSFEMIVRSCQLHA